MKTVAKVKQVKKPIKIKKLKFCSQYCDYLI